MPLKKMIVRPGVNTQFSKTLNEDGWSESQLIRFKDTLPQKMGGWQHLNVDPITGTATGMHAWSDLDGNPYLAVGTEQKLQAIQAGVLIDITPVDNTQNVAVDFSTTSASKTVTIKDVAHGANVGDWITLVTPVSVGGIVLSGTYRVASVVDADNYTITSSSAASSTVSNGGAVPKFDTTNTSATVTVTLNNHGYTTGQTFTIAVSTAVGGLTLSGEYAVASTPSANTFTITAGSTASSTTNAYENSGNVRIEYLLPSGYASATDVSGFGIGTWGGGVWGVGSGATATIPLRQWFLDNWGQNLIGNYTNGGLYQWEPLSGDPATIVTGAPTMMTASFVSAPEQIMVALGAETGGVQDPNLVRWSSVADNTDWVASTVNQAGSYRIPTGSHIVGGLLINQGALIWTDIDVWLMQYIGLPFVFSFTKLGAGSNELIAARAVGNLAQTTFFMSPHGFFTITGGNIQALPCAVWDKIFYNLNMKQADKIFLATNDLFKEVTAWYPSANSDDVDSYVKYNMLENTWDYGTQTGYAASIARTAWIDVSVFGNPIGADLNGLLQQHEIGENADGLPMLEYIVSGYIDLDQDGQGTNFIYVDRLIPDFVWNSGATSIQLSVQITDYPTNEPTTYGPYVVTPTTKYVIVRGRGRQAAIKIAGTGVGTFWRLGATRYLGAPAGRSSGNV